MDDIYKLGLYGHFCDYSPVLYKCNIMYNLVENTIAQKWTNCAQFVFDSQIQKDGQLNQLNHWTTLNKVSSSKFW